MPGVCVGEQPQDSLYRDYTTYRITPRIFSLNRHSSGLVRPHSSMDRVTDYESGSCEFDPRSGPLTAMTTPRSEEKLILLLLSRLERISVDSYWAHRASGVRGALFRALEMLENGSPDPKPAILIATGLKS